jgi:hypothetical protein
MKTPFTATIASLLCSAAAFAEPLSEPDKAYIVLGLAAVRVMTGGAGYEASKIRCASSVTRLALIRR